MGAHNAITHLILHYSPRRNCANANHIIMKKIFALLVLACLVAAALGAGTNVVSSGNVVTAPVSTVNTAKTVTVGTTATNTATVSGILASDNVVFLSSSASLVPFKFF